MTKILDRLSVEQQNWIWSARLASTLDSFADYNGSDLILSLSSQTNTEQK